MSKVLEEIIHESQTAYIPGRYVHDNLRSIELIKHYCKEEKIKGLLVGVDAKKAFDSVDHGYMQGVLRAYGFGPKFINWVKLLNKNLTAEIMVNGFKTDKINIEQSVKQGDALSCSLFILCMDPLIRKVNSDQSIQGLNIGNPTTIDKLCAYADDIVFIIKDNCISLRNLFRTYHNFSKISGIELNTTKTEIMRIGDDHLEREYIIEDSTGQEVQIKSIEAIKVCGITYSYNEGLAYQLNITDKVAKLENQLKRWLCRGLSLEGKTIIVKTFGLSQLIYFLQSCVITENDIDLVNKLIFKFFWNKKWDGKCPDRIKRQVLKNSYQNGGMKAPDVGALDCGLKVKQFINATRSNNKINTLQRLYTTEAAPLSMTQMITNPDICKNEFIKKALLTIETMNKIAHKNYCQTLMKVRTEQAQAMDLVPYLEYFLSLDSRAYFMENQEARAPRAERTAIRTGN